MSKSKEGLINIPNHGNRLKSIDALRGFVMVIMLVDHIRETFFLHRQVSDPVDVFTTSPELFYTRLTSAICAPVFIWLTGLSAWLYSQTHSKVQCWIYLDHLCRSDVRNLFPDQMVCRIQTGKQTYSMAKIFLVEISVRLFLMCLRKEYIPCKPILQ